MKNKKNIYFLLPAVILIWGLLGYRVYSGLQPSTTTNEELTVATFKPQELKETEPFTISTDYRDPFLGTYNKKSVIKKTSKRVEKIAKVPFPMIVYKGMMSSQSKKSVFIITVNGQQFLYKNRTTHNEVKLLKGNVKEVTLQYKGQRQKFKISN